MKKILLLLCLLVSFTSCKLTKQTKPEKAKFDYTLTVAGKVNILDSTVVADIYRVFTNDTAKLKLDDTLYTQDDDLALELIDGASNSLGIDPLKAENAVVNRISPELLAYYVYVVGYVKEPSIGITFEVDKKFEKNWGGKPIPTKPVIE